MEFRTYSVYFYTLSGVWVAWRRENASFHALCMEDVLNKWRRNFLFLCKLKCSPQEIISREILAWENSWHLATGETSAEMPYRWPMTRHYPDPGSASDCLKQISHAARPIRSTTQIWVVTGHQYEISALVSQTAFRGKPASGGVVKYRLLSLG